MPPTGVDTRIDTISRRLRALRDRRGLSIHGLARLSGLSTAHLSRIESGDRQPSIGSLLALAEALGVSAGDLLEGPTKLAGPAHTPGAGFDQDGVWVTPLGGSGRDLESFRIEVPGGTATWPVQQHPGEECAYVLEGTLRLELDDEVHHIEPGAAAHYSARQRHRFTSASEQPVVVLLVTSLARPGDS